MAFIETWHGIQPEYFNVQRADNFTYPMHSHYCYEVIAVQTGTMTVTVDEDTFTLEKGQLAVIFPNQLHALRSERQSSHVLCIFSSDMVGRYDRKASGNVPKVNVLDVSGYIYDIFCGISNDDSIYTVKGILYLILGAFDEQVGLTKKKRRNKQLSLLSDILDYIQSNCYDDCTLSGLSKTIKYDYSYLSKFFKSNVGVSFGEYVSRMRVNHACYLLRNTGDTVLSISSQCGFNSLRTFNRCFAVYMGCTPAAFRTLPDSNDGPD